MSKTYPRLSHRCSGSGFEVCAGHFTIMWINSTNNYTIAEFYSLIHSIGRIILISFCTLEFELLYCGWFFFSNLMQIAIFGHTSINRINWLIFSYLFTYVITVINFFVTCEEFFSILQSTKIFQKNQFKIY